MFVKPWGGHLKFKMADAVYISRRMQVLRPGRQACEAFGQGVCGSKQLIPSASADGSLLCCFVSLVLVKELSLK
jgi:hypothetical protein